MFLFLVTIVLCENRICTIKMKKKKYQAWSSCFNDEQSVCVSILSIVVIIANLLN